MKIIRWSGAGAFIVVLLLIGAIGYLFTDDVIEDQLEYYASYYNGARVEIDDLDISFTSLRFSWNRLQVTNVENTMENLIETGEATLDVALLPLIYSNVVVEDMALMGVQTNTPRAEDGKMEFPEQEESDIVTKTVVALTDRAKQSARLAFDDIKTNINTDSLLASLNLTTPSKADSAQTAFNQRITQWNNRIDSLNYRQYVDRLKQDVGAIKPDEIKNPAQAKRALETLKELKTGTDSLKETISTTKSRAMDDIQQSVSTVSQIDEWIQQDITRAQQAAKLPDLSVQNIGEMLFGSVFISKLTTYLGYAGQARQFARVMYGGDEEAAPARSEGRNVVFSDKYDWPVFWTKNMDFSGATPDGLSYSGSLSHFTSNQQKIDEITEIGLKGSREDGAKLELDGSFDYLSEKRGETFTINYSGFPLADVHLSGSDLLPRQLSSGLGSLSANLQLIKQQMSGKIRFTVTEPAFQYDDAGTEQISRLKRLVRSAVDNLDSLAIESQISSKNGQLDFTLASNLDDNIMSSLRATVSQEIEQARQNIGSAVFSRTEEKKQELVNLINERKNTVTKKLDSLSQQVSKLQELINNKREQMQEKATGKLKNKLKDKIDF